MGVFFIGPYQCGGIFIGPCQLGGIELLDELQCLLPCCLYINSQLSHNRVNKEKSLLLEF